MYQRIRNRVNKVDSSAFEEREETEERRNWDFAQIKENFFHKKSIFLYLVSILISKVGLATGINPFGIAILGAISNLNMPIAVCWGIIATTNLIVFGGIACFKFMMASILFVALKSFLKNKETITSSAIKMLVATSISEISVFLFAKPLLYDVLLSLFAGIISAIFYIIFTNGMETAMKVGELKAISSESLAAGSIMLAIAISGLGNLKVFDLSIRGIVCILLVLLLGWKRGAGIGAATGITLSVVLRFDWSGNTGNNCSIWIRGTSCRNFF